MIYTDDTTAEKPVNTGRKEQDTATHRARRRAVPPSSSRVNIKTEWRRQLGDEYGQFS